MSGEPTLQTLEVEEEVTVTRDPAAVVLGWRVEQLIAAGFDGDAAFALALDRTVDLHEAVELVRRGCPPQTALRILI
jgi:rRNA processing protein Krr1/Pno1